MPALHIAIVAGESSGDRLGGPLMEALRTRFPDVRFSGVGGKAMQAAGLQSLGDISQLSVMGLVEVLAHLPGILRLKSDLLSYWQDNPPDLFIGLDAPDFNLRLEKALHQRGIATVHYVSPSLWAWKEKRIFKVKDAVDLMLCLFPFEMPVYQSHRIDAACVGHPMRDRLVMQPQGVARETLNLPAKAPIVGIFPGSRKGEITRLLPVFLQAFAKIRQQIPDAQAVVSVSEAHHLARIKSLSQPFTEQDAAIHLSQADSATLMSASDVLMLASGTITLEATLLQRPMLVAYRVSPLTAFIARRLLKVDRFSLPNLLAGKTIVNEWIQEHCTVENVSQDGLRLLTNKQACEAQLQALQGVSELLPENVSGQAANAIAGLLSRQGIV